MKKGKMFALAAFSCISLGAIALTLSTTGAAFGGLVRAEEVPNMLTLDKMSTRNTSTSKVIGTTAKGNSVQFSYNRFDTRPGDTDWNNCMCFYKMTDGVGGYIKNDTALYGVQSIRLYGYSTSNPTPDTYTSYPFNIYYGYEPIDVSVANTAKVQISNGVYSFEDGLEPSYIAIECAASFDAVVSKVEILYKCEPVQGTISSVEGPAYKYDYVGKEFTAQNGKKVAYNITEAAPWAHSDAFSGSGSNITRRYSASSYDAATKTWTTTGNERLDVYPLSGETFVESTGRKLVSATFTVNVESGATGWGGQNCDIYFGVNGTDSATHTYARLFSTKLLAGTQSWEIFDKVVSIVDAETGADLTGVSSVGKKITITLDARNVDTIKSIEFGSSCAGLSLTFEDLTFKATHCGHKGYTEVSSDVAYQYTAKGTYLACPDCESVLSTSKNITEQAPWLKLNETFADDCTLTRNADGTYTSPAAGWKNAVLYTLPADLQGRTELHLTIKTIESYNLYIYVGGESGNQYFTNSTNFNYGKNALLSKVFDADGNSLNYNSTTYGISSKVGTEKFTMVFDLTKATSALAGATVKVIFYDAGTSSISADLKEACAHASVEEFSNGLNYGTKCTKCGALVTQYADKTEIVAPSDHSDVFSLEKGVTFDGRNDCVKTTITAATNNSAMGYTQNYKLYYRNLVKNAKAAGKTTLSFNVYNKASTNYNIRLYFGVGNNIDYVLADHYNAPTTVSSVTNVRDNITLTTEAGAAAKLPANQWIVITLDISSDAFSATNVSDFFISAAVDVNGTPNYPIETYVSNVRVA